MGWGDLLGDFAKGFAKGYIEERGVKGTLSDLGSLASSIFDSDNVDSGNEEIYTQLCNDIDMFIKQSEYSEAFDLLNAFYEENCDDEQDVIYYYLASEIFVALLEELIGDNRFDEIKESAVDYINDGLEFDDDDFVDEFDELIKRVKKATNKHNCKSLK